jgi:cbb3-type cytochrome oxidase subunit 1
LSEVTKQKLSKLIKQFKNLSEIEALRKVDRYKYVGRNMLGIRKFDDWINNLEIGNIMHLNPITASELMQNIGKHHEFQKDPMLKKLVLLCVSLFSIATEMRMMVQFDEIDKKLKDELQ